MDRWLDKTKLSSLKSKQSDQQGRFISYWMSFLFVYHSVFLFHCSCKSNSSSYENAEHVIQESAPISGDGTPGANYTLKQIFKFEISLKLGSEISKVTQIEDC